MTDAFSTLGTPPRSFLDTLKTTLRDADKLKQVMLKRGLVKAKAVCPECGGMLQGRLSGRKNHMRFWCQGTCGRRMME